MKIARACSLVPYIESKAGLWTSTKVSSISTHRQKHIRELSHGGHDAELGQVRAGYGALGYAKSAVAEEVAFQLGVQRDHAFIREELEMMRAFLRAAHNERDDHRVFMTWVKQVRDVAYDADCSLHLKKWCCFTFRPV
jgi:hypothetical protein